MTIAPNWKGEMNEKWKHIPCIYVGMGSWLLLQDFISTEIIEKLIADIPKIYIAGEGGIELIGIKQQLIDKWL